MIATVATQVTISVPPAAVWPFLSDPERFLAWMTVTPGAPTAPGSTFEPRAGGRVCIVFPNGGEAHGEVVSLEAPRQLVFTWGYAPDVAQTGIGPGATTVDITLAPVAEGTRVTLVHSGPMSEALAQGHLAGWRHYLSQLAVQVAAAHHGAHLAQTLGDYYAAWSQPDAGARAEALARCCEPDVRVRTRFACTDTLEELDAHIANGLRHMRGAVTGLDGDVRHIHGHARVPWAVRMGDAVVFRGESHVRFSAAGRIAEVVSFPS